MMERKEDSAASPEAKTKNKMKNKRRFSDEQIRLLESIFESESTKLEPRKKMRVATDLGLQPRQVAIWFQNKRARWKSKQLELDYAKLRADYDTLASSFESLVKEKETLLLELQMLNEQLGKDVNDNNGDEDLKRSDKGSSNKGNTTKCELEIMEEGLNDEGFMSSQNNNNDYNSFNIGHCGAEEVGIDDSIASSEKWFNDSGGLLGPSTSSSSQYWLNFSWL